MPQWDYPNPRAFDHPNTCRSDSIMSTKLRGDDEPRRRRRKEGSEQRERGEADKDSTSSRDKQQHRGSSHKISSSGKAYRKRSTSREREKDRSTASERGTATKKRVEVVLPEMERRTTSSSSASGIRSQTSYPTFSKAHSREAVHSLEDVRSKPITPATTDVNGEKRRNSTPAKPPVNPPPSPPLTADNPDIRRSDSASSIRRAADEARANMSEGRRSTEGTPRTAVKNVKNLKSGGGLRREAVFGQSELSSMPGAFPEDERRTTPSSGFRRTVSTASQPQSILTQNTQNTEDTGRSESTVDSGATTLPPERKAHAQRPPRIVPVFDDLPQPHEHVHEVRNVLPKKPKIIDVSAANLSTPQSFGMTPITAVPPMPPPPPPPPPVASSKEPPRVDYLLKHGGLPTMVPRRLVQMAPSIQQYSMYQSPAILQQAPLEEYSRIFSSIHKRLDDYLQVLRTSGSLAVATGYKSVARRLLDKLSQVFARDISSVRCDCVMCKTTPQPALSDEEDSGISWGEILEIVSGRRELPQWPPFSIKPDDGGLGISGVTQAPMQKLDIDVPEEYKDHYIRQNQKTKRAVQSWLSMQPDFPSSPPEEADEDTLMFAMMTKLDMEQRNFFIALMHGQSTVHSSRAPTPAERPATASTALQRARKALQRLYRLDRSPRDCESAMYLLNNAPLHGMLATLAEVNEAEWDILVSGRFDGFLWSGAEAPFPASASQYASPTGSRAPSRGMAGSPFSRNMTPFSGMSGAGPPQPRGNTPFSPLRNAMSPSDTTPPLHGQQTSMFPSRNPTPALGLAANVGTPAPVQMDEDTEIAVLAEVERNLFNDMERFEDAFEVLHSRAELVRQLLRERSAGLSLSAQLRRGSGADAAFVRLDTPASGITDFEDEDDDGLGDTASLAPDDSASQISVNRRHRRRQGRENRTPAPVVEEDEGESVFEEERAEAVRRGMGGGGRRSKY
ncbi:hypothetical protein LTR78_002519 [Recurvomyces mirabilis]|uniref:5-Methylcytosine G/T mismatch-specific DNA glycosylase n=1 Tax=Recurvomyces mirabilis TaxID=574656 RepID=A0AAE1C4M4_9PEZI|nr:hypothetical protein LTR78_002519 [Recurvomyces mirabilis]KAK5157448.1 hypothetical protein LTS14_004213 [Recurvomyces mirabilis]